ncbi:MAG: PQQ-like beta-propeller repeat protein [Bdellovibrionaceae bacterium]|nr:PQQ-like beta-propeller repeat protein [Bdellovibrionales bacterium]MCB9083946.1 PQQ-like beta-propeller repeat protein [Pseudobdellovibrionaceae bacterium]
MEPDKGRLSLLNKALSIVYIVICLFFVFKNNPYLYSTETLKSIFHKEKQDIQAPVPTPQKGLLQTSDLKATFMWRMNPSRSASHDPNETFNRKYEKLWARDLWVDGDPLFRHARWSFDDSGFFLVADQPVLVATDPSGNLKWKLQLDEKNALFSAQPAITKTRVYATTTNGRVFCLDKQSGHIYWTIRAASGTRGAPILIGDQLFFFAVEEEDLKKRTHLFSAHPETGEVTRVSKEDLGPINNLPPTVNETLNALYVASEAGNLFALNYESGKLLFKTSTSDKILSGVILAEKKAIFTTMDGKLVAVDAKSGTMAWETDLESPSDSTPTFIPDYNLISVMTNNGYLQTVDINNGERKWKFLTHNGSPHHNTITLRLKGKWIEEHEMKWRYKGWVILAPCAEKRVCIYNPERGQIVGRIYLDGPLTSETIVDGKEFMVSVLTKNKETGEETTQLLRLGEKNQVDKTTAAPSGGSPSKPAGDPEES